MQDRRNEKLKRLQKDSTLGFIRAFSLSLAGIGLCAGYKVLNTPVELVSPFDSINYIAPKQAQAEEHTFVATTPVFENEIDQYIYEVFGEDYQDAKTILSCENKGLNPNAVNHNRNGSIDEGIFQINTIHGQKDMFDYRKNIDFAYKLMKKGGWSQWSCSHKIGVTPFYLK